MARGTVNWFNGPSGFGRIVPDDPGAELFVHRGSIVDPDGTLRAGDRVDFELCDGGMGPQATEVRPSPAGAGMRPGLVVDAEARP